MWNAEFKLYLYPEQAELQANLGLLKSLLRKIEFIGVPLSQNRYSVGEDFLSLLTFMGCSPNIELEPQDNKPYCYIELISQINPQFISGQNTKYPACPQCKEKLKTTHCKHCDKTLDVVETNWRKTAFFASSWICIGNIYELEAIPNDLLLNILENETGVKWRPAYIRQKQT